MDATAPKPLVLPDPPEAAMKYDRTFLNYFMFKPGRIPKLRYEPRPEPSDPDSEREKWDAFLIKKEYGLITKQHLDDAGIPEDSIVREDVNVLNRTLVRAFINEDYDALYWQNQYFLFQWLFAFFALLATIFAVFTIRESLITSGQALTTATENLAATLSATAISTITSGTPSATLAAPVGTISAPQTPMNNSWASGYALITTFIGALVTILVYIYNRDRPQRTWYETRRNAESLRKQYFLYLAHMPPYDTQQHVYALQLMTARIQKSDPKKPSFDATARPRLPTHTEPESEALISMYNTLRIQEQMKYYQRRSREYDYNGDVTLLITLIIPLFVTLLAGLNIAQTNPTIALIVVILPNLAGLFASFQRVYDWDHQQVLYSKTYEGLKEAKIIDTLGKTTDTILRELVNAVEGELTKETDQWGISVEDSNSNLSAEQIIDEFKKKVDANDADVNREVEQMKLRLKLK
jgi:hypothetical protein